MMKRKPDLLMVLAAVLLVGVIATSLLMDSAPEDSDQVATGFAKNSANDVALGAR
ncbi:hypothetical protein HPT27_00920 [Permianibacter sp. IMCC34836]|uniref:hypothetical protein n=1 Tax=Permianibacter fluminis TaxID=2738515 RepID=UPI001551C628|nr:hypothetical protein [Permianibacter fluminis]NQD35562.1 hypothetical protein [Permianibacter fluminis]